MNILLLILLAIPAFARVENPAIFLGQQSFGTTAGAPLSTDANNQVISGITNAQVTSATAGTCTTGGISLTGITATPVAGTYLVLFGGDFNSAAAGEVITIVYQIAAVSQGASQRKFMPFTGGTLTTGSQRITASLNSILVVNGSQAITVNCSTSTSTATAANAEMQVVRLQ